MNTMVLISLKHTGKATVILPVPNAPRAMWVRSPAGDPAHTDLYALNAFGMSSQGYPGFPFFPILSFSPFSLFLERWRSRSRVIVKTKSQHIQQTALQTNGNFSQDCMTVRRTVHLPGRRDGSEVFTHGLDNSSAPDPETHADPNAPVEQQPDWGRRFLHDPTLLVDKPERHEGSDGIAGETEKQHPGYRNAGNCLGRSVLFSTWSDLAPSRLARPRRSILIELLSQLSLHH